MNWKYLNDPTYHKMVDSLVDIMRQHRYTKEDMIEMVELACSKQVLLRQHLSDLAAADTRGCDKDE